MTGTTIRVFWAALTANWPTAMSGPVSVLFVIAAFLFRMKQQDTDLRICGCRSHLPRRCIYWIWSAGRTRGDALEKKTAVLESMRPELELIFNEQDPLCVRDEHYYWFDGRPLKARHWP
jgi:hypothetical protein